MSPMSRRRRGPRSAAALLVGLGLLAAVGLGTPTASASSFPAQVPGAARSSVRADSVTDRKRALDKQLDDLRETLEGTSKRLVDAAVELARTKSELVDAKAELAGAHATLVVAQKKDAALADRLAVAEAAVDKAQRDLDSREQEETDTRGRLGTIAREAYVSSGLSGLSIALNAESPDQFADRVDVAGTALRDQNGAIARLEVQQAETRARQSRLEAARSTVAGLKVDSEAAVAELKTAETAAAAAASKITGLVASQQAAVKTISAHQADEKKRVKALQAQESKLSALLKKRARSDVKAAAKRSSSSGGVTNSNGSGRLSFPVNAPITSGFGYRYHPILHYRRLHAGTDFGAPCGTPVHAAAPGRIVRAGRAGGFGNQVVIAHGVIHGKSIATSYNHLSRFVKTSGSVRRGQVIAYSGTTGLSTGCHLHFEVYVNGVHVNPMSWL